MNGHHALEPLGDCAAAGLPRPAAGQNEFQDDYRGVVAVLGPRWRVVDSLERFPIRQWILQYRTSLQSLDRWRSGAPNGSFCQNRDVLLRCIREKAGVIDATALALIEALPAHIREMEGSGSNG